MRPWARAAVQGAACGLMLGLVLLIGGRLWRPEVAAAQAKPAAVPDVVKAKSFQVVDAAGKRRAGMAVDSDGNPFLGLFDAAGTTRARLAMISDGTTALAFYDAAGKGRAMLSIAKDGRPSLMLLDSNEIRAVLGATSLTAIKTEEVTIRPESSLVLFDKDGKVMWQAP